MIEKPTLIRMIQMIDVRRRWGLFCAGAEARGVRAGMGSKVMAGLGACLAVGVIRGEAVGAVRAWVWDAVFV